MMDLSPIAFGASVAAVLGGALTSWRCERLARLVERDGAKRDDGTERGALEAARQSLRAAFLAGGYGKHRAYHVTDGGTLLAVDAAYFYLAYFAGVQDFWELVAEAHGDRGNPFAVTLDEAKAVDGECGFTFVDYYGRKTFVGGRVLGDVVNGGRRMWTTGGVAAGAPYHDLCPWVSADEFENAVVHAQAEAAERKSCRYA